MVSGGTPFKLPAVELRTVVSIGDLAYPSRLPTDMRDAPCLPVKRLQGITQQQTNVL